MTTIDAFRRDLDGWLADSFSEENRRRMLVAVSEEGIARWHAQWKTRYERARAEVSVDGRLGAPLTSVRVPGGVIAARINAIAPIVDRALELLDQFTKVVTGGYKSQTFVFVDDVPQTDVSAARLGDLVTIANVSPFARKAERRGFNVADGAPFTDGLFEGVSAILKREFNDTLNTVYFTFRDYGGAGRVPMIAIGEGAAGQGRRPRGYVDAYDGGGRRFRRRR